MTIARFEKPGILKQIPRDKPAVIEASAGTGKTYTIEHLVIDLLLDQRVGLGEILVLTFTERAATELRQRIRKKIAHILTLSKSEGDHLPLFDGAAWVIDAEERALLERALFGFDGASIGTIHGFFGRIQAEHAFDDGRLFEETLEDGRGLFGRAFKDTLRRNLARRPGVAAELLEVWLEQYAGPESLADLLYKCHASRRTVRPPFSLETLRQEIETNALFALDLLGEIESFARLLKASKVHHSTIKSIRERLLPSLAAAVGRGGRSLAAVLGADAYEAIRKIGLTLADKDVALGSADSLAASIFRLAEVLVPFKAAIIQTCLPQIRLILERQKRTMGVYEFDDILQGVARTVDGPRGDSVVRALRRRYRYALIDEFQDTDELQWTFFRRVFVESEGKNPVYLIGDPKQAIYGFRGADVDTYLDAVAEVKQLGSPVVPLAENYRSTPALIDAYNLILDQASPVPFFNGRIRYDTPVSRGQDLTVEEGDGASYAPIHILEIEPKGEKLDIAELRRGLARRIAREARELLSTDRGFRIGKAGAERPLGAGEIYVLATTNQDGIRVARALREARVPFAFYKQEGLFQSPEALAVRDLLAAIAEPSDPSRRGRVWISPFFDVPLQNLPDCLELPESHPLVARLIAWKELADAKRFERLFSRILDDSGLIRRLLFLRDEERALTNFLHLFEILLEDARSTGCGLDDLLATLNAYIIRLRTPPGEDGNVQRLESDRDAVQIMSIHKSKGLEAAVVFLYGGFTSNPPDGLHEFHDGGERILFVGDDANAKSQAALERDQELQRLYYVALTRAKARLYLPLVPQAFWNSRWDGGYRRVNDRLSAIVSGLDSSVDPRLFRRIPFRDEPIPPEPDVQETAGRDPLTWRPSRDLLEDRNDWGKYTSLKSRHAGYSIASYSQMKTSWETEIDPLTHDEYRREPDFGAPAVLTTEEELPGGTTSGTLLHDILETVPLESLKQAESLEEWGQRPEVASVVDEALTRNVIDPKFRTAALAIVYHALTAEVSLGSGPTIAGLGRCPRVLREMEFLFPYPEASHPTLSEPRAGKLVIERGFIKGFVDLVVEYEGLVYFADWKSDILPSYDAPRIAAHVRAHYELQARLYSLALVKALGIHHEPDYESRFGGLIYVFLRGFRPGSEAQTGLFFNRPTWSDILQYEHEVKEFREPSHEK